MPKKINVSTLHLVAYVVVVTYSFISRPNAAAICFLRGSDGRFLKMVERANIFYSNAIQTFRQALDTSLP